MLLEQTMLPTKANGYVTKNMRNLSSSCWSGEYK